jgi:hypothetical protein
MCFYCTNFLKFNPVNCSKSLWQMQLRFLKVTVCWPTDRKSNYDLLLNFFSSLLFQSWVGSFQGLKFLPLESKNKRREKSELFYSFSSLVSIPLIIFRQIHWTETEDRRESISQKKLIEWIDKAMFKLK